MLVPTPYRPVSRNRFLQSFFLGSGLTAAMLCQPALAAPSGAKVVKGNVQIKNTGNLTTINASNNSVINWQQFGIAKGETLQFIQPSAASRVLNRVTGGQFSLLAGHLTANGIVYLVNPAGVYISTGAIVNVGGLYAAAGTISDSDFQSHTNHFTNISNPVSNQGTIQGQTVALVGTQVSNDGSIVAPKGTVTMAAGQDVYLTQTGSPLVVKVSLPTLSSDGSAPLTNTGSISAPGGNVSLVTGDVYALALQDSGAITGSNVTLNGGVNGTTQVTGTIDASNTAAGAKGGNVQILGGNVALQGAAVDASGAAGGGTVLVGGDLHGQGSTPTAANTLVDSGSTIHADALNNGNGGEVVVWSDQGTSFSGAISARGGASGGNGGLVEVSSHGTLGFGGTADLRAPQGTTGLLLLDPTDITISTGTTTTGMTFSNGQWTNLTTTPSNLNTTDLQTQLNLSNVNVSTSSSLAGNGDITVQNPISWSSGNTLTLTASRDITVNAGATITGTGAGSGLSMTAPRNITLGANLTVASLNLQAGTGGTGSLTFSAPGLVIAAGTQSYRAGNGSGAVSTVDLVTNNPTFEGTAGTSTSPTSLTYRQDAAINDSNIPAATQFGGAVPKTYNITTDDGALTLTTPAKVAGSNLTLSAQGAGDAVTITSASPLSLASLTVDTSTTGSINITLPSVTTAGGQTYSGPLALLTDLTLTDTGGGAITFSSTVDGAHNLTVNTSGNEVFNGVVGGITPLLSLTTDASGTIGGATQFNMTLPTVASGTAGGVNAGAVTINDQVSFNMPASSSASPANPSNPAVVTTGSQLYNQGATLGADTSLVASGASSNITFGSTVDGAHNLTVNAGMNELFNGVVGGVTPLLSLTSGSSGTVGGTTQFNMTLPVHTATNTAGGVNVGTLTINNQVSFNEPPSSSTALSNPSVVTTGNQIYNGAVTLGADTSLAASGSSSNITFASTIETNGTSWTLTTQATGTTWFQGSVGNVPGLELGALTISPGSGASEVTQLGFQGGPWSLTTVDQIATRPEATGSISFGDNVVLMGNTTITALTTTTAGTLTSTEGNLTFGGTINTSGNPWTLTINAPGVTGFKGNVGAIAGDALGALTINPQGGALEQTQFGAGGTNPVPVTIATTESPSTTAMFPDGTTTVSVTVPATTGAQTYGDPVVLMANTTLTSLTPKTSTVSLGEGDIAIKGTINGAFNLIITAADATQAPNTTTSGTTTTTVGNVNVGGAIGNTSQPTLVTITGNSISLGAVDAAGNITLTSSSLADSTGKAPAGVIELGGALTTHASGGNTFSITLNTLTTPLAGQATVFAANGGSLDFQTGGGTFDASAGTTISAGGSVTIGAGAGMVTVGDISAGKDIVVDGGSITINKPADFVAGGSITFSKNPGLPLTDFATTSGQSLSLGGVNKVGARSFGPITLAQLFKTGGGPGGTDMGFNLVASGTVINNPADALAGADDIQDVPGNPFWGSYLATPAAVSASDAAELRQLGVNVLTPTPQDALDTVGGAVLLYNLPTVPAEVTDRHDYTVAAKRLAPQGTARVLADFRDLFEVGVPASADTAAHFTIDQRKVGTIRDSLVGAISEYNAQAKGAAFDPTAFRGYLLHHKSDQAAATANLARLDTLMSDVAALDLPPRELGEVRQRISALLDLPPGTISAADFDRLLAPKALRG